MAKEDGIATKKRPGNVFYIGLLSFFGGISQDIFVPVLPLYLANVLGLDRAFIGLSEGLVTSGASIFRVVAGVVSDKFKKRKAVIFVGYFLSLASRPLLAFVTSGTAILGLRFLDGVGKGVKDAPKSALIASSAAAKSRGRDFGIARMLDTLGSVAGPLILFALLYFFQHSPLQYHYILLFTAVPLLATLGVLIFKVKEAAPPKDMPVHLAKGNPRTQRAEQSSYDDKKLPRTFYWFLAIASLFALGNSSDAFLILRAQNVGVTLLAIPLVFALFNFVYAAASVPLGSLSDRIGREKVMCIGWFAYAIAYIGFGLASSAAHIWLLFAFYGIYYATTEGVAKAFIADIVDEERRGTAYGIYNTTVGLLTLPASVVAGFLWDTFNPSTPFYFGAAMSLAAAALLLVLMLHRAQERAFAR
ncbi:MFS transporter [Candidatus Azambacteria bacterium]|nr:MFS transporter [Candidatus Azambacteria bacterium]MBI3685670.1 MFS transporter [Candidatus Azambacteria bacterium]